MAGLATTVTTKSVSKLINSISDEGKRADAKALVKLLKDVTKKTPKVWGDNFLIGFGAYTYKRKGSNEEFEWFNVGFAPRKNNITIYVAYDLSKEKALLKKLGPHKIGKGCLYIKRLSDVDMSVLKKIIAKSKNAAWA